jgi:hypothetical protein
MNLEIVAETENQKHGPTSLAGVTLKSGCDKCTGKKAVLQRAAVNSDPDIVPSIVHEVLGSPGQPLDAQTRTFMDSRFVRDFSLVRIHTDAKASESAQAVNALAHTIGQDVVSLYGKKQLAYESTNVIPQANHATSLPSKLFVNDAHDMYENEADAVANKLIKLPVATDCEIDEKGNAATGISLYVRDAVSSMPTRTGVLQRRLDWDITPIPAQQFAPRPPGPAQERIDEVLRIDDFGSLSEIERFEKLEILLSAETGAQTIQRIWETFGDSIALVAARHPGTWERSVRLSSNLDELPAVIRLKQIFERDVKGMALSYMETNRRYITTEMQGMGIGTQQITASRVVGARGGLVPSIITMQVQQTVPYMTPEMTPEQASQLESIRGIAHEIKRAQEYEQALRHIFVGYRIDLRRAGGDYWEVPVPTNFNPDYRPEGPPTGSESPPMHSWDEVRQKYDQNQSAISGFGNRFPAIYAAIRDDRIDDIIQSTPQQARSVLATSLVNVLNNIDQTRPRIEGGSLDYRDLQPIHQQLLNGGRGASRTDWRDPFNRWVVNDILSDHAAREFWIQLGLGSLAAAAFLVAELATAGSATFFIAAEVGLAASVTQAGRSWERYRNLSTAAESNVSNEMALVSSGQVNEALIGSILDTVGAFLDVAGVGVHIARAGRTILPEFALAGARRGAIEGLERVSSMGIEEARSLITRSVSELGIEQTATRSSKSLEELIEIVGDESDIGRRIGAFREARQAGLIGSEDLVIRLGNLSEELRIGPGGVARLTRTEADRLAVQAIEQFGPVRALQLVGGWKKLAGALGDDSLAGRYLYSWRDALWADTEQFLIQQYGSNSVRRTGSYGRFSNDLDFSLLGPNASVNRDRARSFLAGRAGISPENLDTVLASTAFADPRRLHTYDYLTPALREQMADEAARFERSLIWNRRLYDARHATPPNEALVTQIRTQMADFNIAESTFVPLSREDLTRLYREIDSLHQELEDVVQSGDLARQNELVRNIGRKQSQINASEEGAYMSGGGGREFVSERPGETAPIPKMVQGAPRLVAEDINAVLDQLPMLDHAASGLDPARGLDDLADSIKGVGKYGERLSTVGGRLHMSRSPYGDSAVFDTLAERCRGLVARARGQADVALQQQLREDLNAVLNEVRGLTVDLESASNELLSLLNAQGAMPGVQDFGRISLLTRSHIKYLRARDAIIWQLSIAVRGVRLGVTSAESTADRGSESNE